jgi:acyl phosphate:glycerol-3-phosphate acyltransferase
MTPLSSFMMLMVGGLWPWLLYALSLGYLVGSIPFGLLLTRAAGLGDVRKIGSGNIGATNVLRTGNKGLAAATLLLDALKGTAVVLLANHLWGQAPAMLAGLGAFLGHLYPVWLRFKGGKGVATYIGVLLGWAWPGAFFFCSVWALTAFTTRFSSLAAIAASILTPVFLFWKSGLLSGVPLNHITEIEPTAMALAFGILSALMTLLLLWKHRANIKRLRQGEEPKIGAKA